MKLFLLLSGLVLLAVLVNGSSVLFEESEKRALTDVATNASILGTNAPIFGTDAPPFGTGAPVVTDAPPVTGPPVDTNPPIVPVNTGRPTNTPVDTGAPVNPATGRPTDAPVDTGAPVNPATGRPTRRPRPSGRPRPTKQPGQPDQFFERFMKLLQNSVANVKPDEHPDEKYKGPGQRMVNKLLVLKQAVNELMKPLTDIVHLMLQDYMVMMMRVRRAVRRDNIFQAKHVVGEYFIALHRRFAMFAMHAYHMGLFDNINPTAIPVKRYAFRAGAQGDFTMKFMKYFNQFRVSDGLSDSPFVKLGVKLAKTFVEFFKQVKLATEVSKNVYQDMLVDMIRLSVEQGNHEAAVQRAGAGVISNIRRGTKIAVILGRIYRVKKCFGSRPPPK